MHFRDSKNSEHFESHQTQDVSQFLVLPLYTRRDTNPLQVPKESFEIVFHPLRVKAQSLWSHIRRIRVQSRLHRMRSSQRHDLLRTENWLYLLMHYLCSCVVSILKDMIKILSQHSGLIFLNLRYSQVEHHTTYHLLMIHPRCSSSCAYPNKVSPNP